MILGLFEEKYLYLFLNIGAILGPLGLSFHPLSKYYKTWFAQVPAMLIAAAIFIAWDVAFTEMGIWGFNPRYLTGIYFFNLPIEECLFFISVPYACIFSYHSVKVLTKKSFAMKSVPYITWPLLALMLIVGIVAFRWYTTTTFLSLFFFTILVVLVLKKAFVGRFYFTYLLILVPFFLMNGVLTGSGIEDQVVWYNDTQNLSTRLATIPIEDTFYGMLLIFLNVMLYEYFLFLGKNEHQDWVRTEFSVGK